MAYTLTGVNGLADDVECAVLQLKFCSEDISDHIVYLGAIWSICSVFHVLSHFLMSWTLSSFLQEKKTDIQTYDPADGIHSLKMAPQSWNMPYKSQFPNFKVHILSCVNMILYMSCGKNQDKMKQISF